MQDPDDRAMPKASTVWRKRVSSWRASGETAEQFGARHGFAPATLKWWASQLRRGATSAPAAGRPVVRLAQLVRSPTAASVSGRGAVVVEWLEPRLRITVEAGADRDTLVMVLGLIAPRVER
jgi:hypothetical protein